MTTINIPDEKVYFVYNIKTKKRVTRFYSSIGPAKSDITSRRSYSRNKDKDITDTYVICEMFLKLDACNQYRYDESKKTMELSEMAKAIYL